MEEDIVDSAVFGTPLKPIDEDDVASQSRPKPIAIHEQIVTDDKGRRRFHGAFTGGFSAGYFNTVGTRDGWTPKNFKSSRSQQQDSSTSNTEKSKFQQKYEDFMDEEDVADFGIAPKKLQASSNFFKKTSTAANNQKHFEAQDDFERKNARLSQISDIFRGNDQRNPAVSFGQPVLEKLFVPVQETVGVRLLREMGWKPGQGIGPRITKRSKMLQKKANQRLYHKTGSALNDLLQEDTTDELVEKYRDFLFAPDDIHSSITSKAKDNVFGIAYRGLDRNELTSSEHFNLFTPVLTVSEGNRSIAKSHNFNKAARPSSKIVGHAFGVGVYEDEDEDIYAKDDVNRYDFYLDNTQGNDKKQASQKRSTRWEEGVENDKCLPGFVHAKKSSTVHQTVNFPPPKLPKNYHPRPVKRSRFEPVESSDKQDQMDFKKESLSSNAKNNETQKDSVQQAPRHNIQSEQRKNEMANENNHTCSSQTSETSLEELRLLAENIQNQHLAASLAKSDIHSASTSFKPYVNDPPKQKRYEQYILCLKNGRRDVLPLLQPKDMTEWERSREQGEFDRAAILYQNSESDDLPASKNKSTISVMSSRFVSASETEELDVAKCSTLSDKDKKIQLTEAEKAAQLKCYGKLTREKVDWHPSRILCIRFNVKQPYGDSSIIGVPAGYKCRLDIFKNVDLTVQKQAKIEVATNADNGEPKPKPNQEIIDKYSGSTLANPSKEPEIENEKAEETFKKASNDLFKAIFLDSDDSDSSDNDIPAKATKLTESKEVQKDLSPKTDEKIESGRTILSKDKQSIEISPGANKKDINEDSSKIRLLNQPKGLFSNIDFSRFAKNRKTEDAGQKNENVIIGPSRKRPTASDFYHQEDTEESKKDCVLSSADEFGPQKPKVIKPSISSLSHKVKDIQESDDSSEWLEKSDSTSKRNSKSKTKKDKKRKSKHKHRKEKKKKDYLNERHKRRKSKKAKLEAKKKRKKHKHYSSTDSSSSQSDDRSSRTDSSSDSG